MSVVAILRFTKCKSCQRWQWREFSWWTVVLSWATEVIAKCTHNFVGHIAQPMLDQDAKWCRRLRVHTLHYIVTTAADSVAMSREMCNQEYPVACCKVELMGLHVAFVKTAGILRPITDYAWQLVIETTCLLYRSTILYSSLRSMILILTSTQLATSEKHLKLQDRNWSWPVNPQFLAWNSYSECIITSVVRLYRATYSLKYTKCLFNSAHTKWDLWQYNTWASLILHRLATQSTAVLADAVFTMVIQTHWQAAQLKLHMSYKFQTLLTSLQQQLQYRNIICELQTLIQVVTHRTLLLYSYICRNTSLFVKLPVSTHIHICILYRLKHHLPHWNKLLITWFVDTKVCHYWTITIIASHSSCTPCFRG